MSSARIMIPPCTPMRLALVLVACWPRWNIGVPAEEYAETQQLEFNPRSAVSARLRRTSLTWVLCRGARLGHSDQERHAFGIAIKPIAHSVRIPR